MGNAFTLDYFAASDDYWDDYEAVLAGSRATANSEDWEIFEATKKQIDKRFTTWKTRCPSG